MVLCSMQLVIPTMQKVTVSLDERHIYELRARQRIGEGDSRSDALRRLLDEYATLQQEYEKLHTRYEARGERISQLQDQLDAREQRVEDLEEQLRERHDIKNEIQDLPDKIRDADTYTERRQRKLDQASVLQRVKWKVTGVPVEESDE